ncbi:MAG: hypothetical protein QM796_19480 [Chthoniobacteraceae bacterium]
MKALTFIWLTALFTGLDPIASAQEMGPSPESIMNLPTESVQVFLLRMKPELQREHAVSLITKELERITFLETPFQHTPLAIAVMALNHKLAIHNARPGVTKIPEVKVSVGLQESIAQADKQPWVLDSDKGCPISLNLHTSAKEYLAYFTQAAGGLLQIEPDGLWIVPICNPESVLSTRSFVVPTSIVATPEAVTQLMLAHFPGLSKGESAFDWSYDQKAQLLHIQAASTILSDFEDWYAHKLISLGYKVPTGRD